MKDTRKKQDERVRITAKRREIHVDLETGMGTVEADLDLKNGLLMGLVMTRARVKTQKAIEELGKIIDYLQRHLIEIKSISPTLEPHIYRFEYSAGAYDGEVLAEVQGKINDYLCSEFVTLVVSKMMGTAEGFLEHLRTREELLRKKEEALKKERERKGRVRVPKQIAEQMHDKVPAIRQVGLWDRLMDGTKETLINEYQTREAAIEYVNRKGEGINLKRDYAQMLRCIAELLHEKSQNNDPKAIDYYTGNANEEPKKIGIDSSDGWEQTIAPKLGLTISEVARKWAGVDRPSGKDQKAVKKILYDMAEKPEYRCLMQWTFHKTDKGKRRQVSLSTYAPLWSIYEVRDGEQKAPGVLLVLHPVFRADIENAFFMSPTLRQVSDAYGRGRIPETVNRLIWEIARWQSIWNMLKPGPAAGTRTQEIGQIRLFQKIAPEYMPPNKQKTSKILEYFNRGVETAKKLGMLAEVRERVGADGGIIYMFDLLGEGTKKRKKRVEM